MGVVDSEIRGVVGWVGSCTCGRLSTVMEVQPGPAVGEKEAQAHRAQQILAGSAIVRRFIHPFPRPLAGRHQHPGSVCGDPAEY